MQNYVYLFQVTEAFEPTPEEEKALSDWYASFGDKLVDSGNPFNPKAQAQVSKNGITYEDDTIAGYTIVEAEDLDEAIKMAQSCPFLEHNMTIDVYETMPM